MFIQKSCSFLSQIVTSPFLGIKKLFDITTRDKYISYRDSRKCCVFVTSVYVCFFNNGSEPLDPAGRTPKPLTPTPRFVLWSGRTCMRSSAHMYPLPSKSKWSNAFRMFSSRKNTPWKSPIETKTAVGAANTWMMVMPTGSLSPPAQLFKFTFMGRKGVLKNEFWRKAIWAQVFMYQ